MRAAQLKERPGFDLMKQTDIQSIFYMQMPRWLFYDPRCAELSLEAKVAYTFLLNRFQLSRRKGWTNEFGEVFVIFPRKALAKELRICEQRVTAAFRQLVEAELVWEKRCGRGDANQIYLARVEPQDDPDYECTPFASEDYESGGSRTAESEVLDGEPRVADAQEPQDLSLKNREIRDSRTAESAVAEPQDLLPSKKEKRNKERIQKEVSPSVERATATDGQNAEEELTDILDACELSYFPPETARVLENAVERLYYSDNLRVGSATLPQILVRKRLRYLDHMTLRDALSKLAANTEKPVKNSTAYTMVTIFNAITESESDLMVDPYLNSLALPTA